MDDTTKAKMLVWEKGVASRPTVSVSVRTEPVLESPEDVSKRKRREASLRHYYRHRDKINNARRESNRLREAKRRREQGDYVRAVARLWRLNNKEKVQAQRKRYRERHGDRLNQYCREYRRKQGPRTAYFREKHREQIDNISPTYARNKLSRGTMMPQRAWPEPLVKLKQAELKLKRLWKRQKDSNTSMN